MEEDFLKKIEKDSQTKAFGSKKNNIQIWYNQDGDCVQFQTMHVGVLRERIDDYLTVYRSAEDNEPIGFQLKDVHALINKYELEGVAVQAGYSIKDNKLISVAVLMLKAFAKMQPSINRVAGYGDAFRTLTNDKAEVEIPA